MYSSINFILSNTFLLKTGYFSYYSKDLSPASSYDSNLLSSAFGASPKGYYDGESLMSFFDEPMSLGLRNEPTPLGLVDVSTKSSFIL